MFACLRLQTQRKTQMKLVLPYTNRETDKQEIVIYRQLLDFFRDNFPTFLYTCSLKYETAYQQNFLKAV